jgi:hypothetical protein
MLCVAPLVMIKEELRAGELALLLFYADWLVTNYGARSLKDLNKAPEVVKFMKVSACDRARIVHRG